MRPFSGQSSSVARLVFPLLDIAFVAPAADAMDARQLLEHMSARGAVIQNVHSVTLWEEYREGKPHDWTKATVHSDDLGRIRYFAEHGDYEDGERVSRRTDCWIHNGEISVYFNYNYRVTKDAAADQTHADIYDGPAPGSHGPFSLRNPLGYAGNGLISAMEDCLKQRGAVTVSPIKSRGPDLLEVVFQRRAPEGGDSITGPLSTRIARM